MGVKLLWTYVQTNLYSKRRQQPIPGRRLAIDAYSFILHVNELYMKRVFNHDMPGAWGGELHSFEQVLELVIAWGFGRAEQLVFVLDGRAHDFIVAADLKADEDAHRRMRRMKKQAMLRAFCSRSPAERKCCMSRGCEVTGDLILDVGIAVLEKLSHTPLEGCDARVHVIHAAGEADDLLSALVVQGVCQGVVSSDTDFLTVAGCTWHPLQWCGILRILVQNAVDELQHPKGLVKRAKVRLELPTLVPSDLGRKLRLHEDFLGLLGAFTGNDYTKHRVVDAGCRAWLGLPALTSGKPSTPTKSLVASAASNLIFWLNQAKVRPSVGCGRDPRGAWGRICALLERVEIGELDQRFIDGVTHTLAVNRLDICQWMEVSERVFESCNVQDLVAGGERCEQMARAMAQDLAGLSTRTGVQEQYASGQILMWLHKLRLGRMVRVVASGKAWAGTSDGLSWVARESPSPSLRDLDFTADDLQYLDDSTDMKWAVRQAAAWETSLPLATLVAAPLIASCTGSLGRSAFCTGCIMLHGHTPFYKEAFESRATAPPVPTAGDSISEPTPHQGEPATAAAPAGNGVTCAYFLFRGVNVVGDLETPEPELCRSVDPQDAAAIQASLQETRIPNFANFDGSREERLKTWLRLISVTTSPAANSAAGETWSWPVGPVSVSKVRNAEHQAILEKAMQVGKVETLLAPDDGELPLLDRMFMEAMQDTPPDHARSATPIVGALALRYLMGLQLMWARKTEAHVTVGASSGVAMSAPVLLTPVQVDVLLLMLVSLEFGCPSGLALDRAEVPRYEHVEMVKCYQNVVDEFMNAGVMCGLGGSASPAPESVRWPMSGVEGGAAVAGAGVEAGGDAVAGGAGGGGALPMVWLGGVYDGRTLYGLLDAVEREACQREGCGLHPAVVAGREALPEAGRAYFDALREGVLGDVLGYWGEGGEPARAEGGAFPAGVMEYEAGLKYWI